MSACFSVVPLARQLDESASKYRQMLLGAAYINALVDEDVSPKRAMAFTSDVQDNVGKLLSIQDDIRMATHSQVTQAAKDAAEALMNFLRFFDKNAKVHPDGGISCILATSASTRASVVVKDVTAFTYQGDRLDSFNVNYHYEDSKVQAVDAMERASENFYFKPDIM